MLTAQSIINNCYGNAGGINNQFCTTVNRDPATGLFADPAVLARLDAVAGRVLRGA